MNCDNQANLPLFGSLHRAGREEPAYQQDRLAMLCRFALRLADAHDRQTRHVWREIHRLGAGWEQQRKVIESQKEWIEILERERGLLEAEARRLGAEWEKQGAALREENSRASVLSETIAQLSAGTTELQHKLAEAERELRENQERQAQILDDGRGEKEELKARLAEAERARQVIETAPLYRLLRKLRFLG